MATGAMGVMDRTRQSRGGVQLPDFRPALRTVYLGNGRYRPRVQPRLDGLLHPVGLNIAYSLATLFYRVTSFSQHPTYSLICILAVIVFNVVVLSLLRRARSRVDIELLATRKTSVPVVRALRAIVTKGCKKWLH